MKNDVVSRSMRGKWKGLIVGVLTISISFTAFGSVAFAKNGRKDKQTREDSNTKTISSSGKPTQEEYDREQLEGYLTGAGYTEEDNLKISQKFSTDENTEVSYVFSGDDVIGSYVTTEIDGEKLSSFTFDSTSNDVQSIYEEISDMQENLGEEVGNVKLNENEQVDINELVKAAYENGKKIGFRNCKNGQVFFHGKHAEFINGEKQGEEYIGNKGSFDGEEKIKLDDLNDSEGMEVALPSSKEYVENTEIVCYDKTKKEIQKLEDTTSEYNFCAIPFRSNYDGDDWSLLRNEYNNEGICWCAASASILTYKGYKYTTKALYSYLYQYIYPNYYKMFGETPVVPHGNYRYENNIFNSIGGLGYFWSGNWNKLSDNLVEKNLRSDNPIYLAVYWPDNYDFGDYEEAGAHAIVLCGRYKKNNATYYIYMDPNFGDYVVNSIPKSVLNSTDSKFYFIGSVTGRKWEYSWSKYK